MNTYLLISLICVLGYLVGGISIKGVSLGTSGILLVALVFGHFGLVVPAVIKTFGLACFVCAVGIIAGPVFFENFKNGALNYIILGVVTIASGAACCVFAIKVLNIDMPIAVGMLNGALTSTPGLAAALEATGDTITSVGYGVAYPFGVVGVVLFVQLIPRILHTDVKSEMQDMVEKINAADRRQASVKKIDVFPFGFFSFFLAIAAGILLGNVTIPLGGGAQFSLGTSGGPLITGLLLGHFGNIGGYSITPPKATLNVMREFGLAMFLLGAGTEAGQGFLEVLKAQGIKLFVIGAFMTIIPMVIDYVIATKVMKIRTMNALGSICGGMTSSSHGATIVDSASVCRSRHSKMHNQPAMRR